MGLSDWPEEEVQKVHEGLLLIGWRADERLTSEDTKRIREIAREALHLKSAKKLTPNEVDRLAISAFNIMVCQIMNIDERALMASGPYSESRYFSPHLSLIDEATLCCYRGYYTAALATLFIVLESYLLLLSGWKAGIPKPSFPALKASVKRLNDSLHRDEAEGILSKVYSHYDPKTPPQFYFNRHGLLHGMRGSEDVDQMNCARMFILFDAFCFAEGLTRSLIYSEHFYLRHSTYANCVKLGREKDLMERR